MNSIGNLHERINLLFVDDMFECCRTVMAGLSGKYSLHWINNRDEALKQIEKNNYDVVVVDYHLGEETPKGGLDIVKEAHKRKIPVISISRENHRDKSLSSGVNRFVFKKEFFNNVENIISRVLKNGRQQR